MEKELSVPENKVALNQQRKIERNNFCARPYEKLNF